MNLGGLQKNSLIDYPGKLSCVIFLSGCNFDCPYCHNPTLAKGCPECPSPLRDDALKDFLESRRDFLDGVVISGGEPTIQKDLFLLCERIKNLDYPIKLDTNGSRPLELRMLIEQGLVDYVAMDIKTSPSNYDPLFQRDFDPEDLLTSIGVVMESAPDYEFRTTCVRGFVDESNIESIARLIKGAKLYALQQFHFAEMLHPDTIRAGDPAYPNEDMMRFKAIAEPWVRECVVR